MHNFNYKLPPITQVCENLTIKPKTPESIRKLLDPTENLELDVVSLSGSEISDAFQDFHKFSFLSHAKGEKAISKAEADRLTMAQFTENYKEIVTQLREELQIGENMMSENMEAIRIAQIEHKKPKHLPDPIQITIDQSLLDEKILPITQCPEDDIRRESNISYDAMSGVWRMLAANCPNKGFQVSSPNFDAFKQKEPHWLDRPALSWQTLDYSKSKCEKWLSKYHKN